MKSILEKAIATYGPDMQHNVAIEEMSELIKELCKNKRNERNTHKIAEEIADVEIMLEQLKMIHDIEPLVEVIKKKKIQRLDKRIKSIT